MVEYKITSLQLKKYDKLWQEVWQPGLGQDTLPNYQNMVSDIRSGNSNKGGGIGTFILNGITYKKIEVQGFIEREIETHFIHLPKYDVIIGNIYKPPNTQNDFFLAKMKSLIENVKCKVPNNSVFILGGDFNIDCYPANAPEKNKLYDMLEDKGFFNTIKYPTRVTETSKTQIDNIFVSSAHIHEAGIIATDFSDHFGTYLRLDSILHDEHNDAVSLTRNFSPNCLKNLNKLLAGENWEPLYHSDNPVDILQEKLDSLLDLCCPLVKKAKCRKHKEPWITLGIMNSIKRKKKLLRQAVKDKSIRDYAKKYRNVFFKVQRKAKEMYFAQITRIYHKNGKKLWQETNFFLNRDKKSTQEINEIKIDNTSITSSKEISNAFNKFYSEIGVKLANKIPNQGDYMKYMGQAKTTTLKLQQVTINEIEEIITSLKPKLSQGHDGISNKLLKAIKTSISAPLTYVINHAFKYNYMPKPWKLARVVPVFKKGSSTECSNYRPISLLPTFSKVIEKAVENQVRNYLNENNYLTEEQYGFRKGYQTQYAIIKAMQYIREAKLNKEIPIGIFCDLKKAFDTISHAVILQKLKHYGIEPTFFQSYLSNRKQFTEIKGTRSELAEISCGVPQGSILGPLLFLIYIMDLPKATELKTILYADDTTLIASEKERDPKLLAKIITNQLINVAEWFRDNALTTHPQKTMFIVFDNNINLSNLVEFCGHKIEQVESTKFVGVWIDSKLKWQTHISSVENKIRSNMFLILKNKNILTRRHKLLLYNAIILPYLNYCSPIWGHANVRRLTILQKKIIRAINGSKNPICHTNRIFIDLKILKVHELVQYDTIKVICSLILDKHPPCLENVFRKKETWVNTRQSGKLILHSPSPCFKYDNCQLYSAGPRIWNSLSSETQNMASNRLSFLFYLKQISSIKLQ